MSTFIHLDHTVAIKPKRGGGYALTIAMPDGCGRIKADLTASTPHLAQLMAIRIIDILTARRSNQ